MKLNLGCGIDIKQGYINIDNQRGKGVDIIWDLNQIPYPFKDKSIERIYIKNTLEHLTAHPYKLFKEFKRILKKGGMLIIIVPHYTNGNNFNEFHIRHYNSLTFYKISCSTSLEIINTYKGLKLVKEKLNFFKGILFWDYLIEKILNSSKCARLIYEYSILRWIFPARNIYMELEKE